MWEETKYHTTDSVEQVMAYMNERMPGFRKVDDVWLPNPYYVNGRSDYSPLGVLASLAASPPFAPGVGVAIYPSDADPMVTVISVRYDWPAY